MDDAKRRLACLALRELHDRLQTVRGALDRREWDTLPGAKWLLDADDAGVPACVDELQRLGRNREAEKLANLALPFGPALRDQRLQPSTTRPDPESMSPAERIQFARERLSEYTDRLMRFVSDLLRALGGESAPLTARDVASAAATDPVTDLASAESTALLILQYLELLDAQIREPQANSPFSGPDLCALLWGDGSRPAAVDRLQSLLDRVDDLLRRAGRRHEVPILGVDARNAHDAVHTLALHVRVVLSCHVANGRDIGALDEVTLKENWAELAGAFATCPADVYYRYLRSLSDEVQKESVAARRLARQDLMGRDSVGRCVPATKQNFSPTADYVPRAVASGKETQSTKSRRTKRSTVRGEGRVKLIAALTTHHEYSNGACTNFAPIGNNELARQAQVADATASEFFKANFQGHVRYRAMCADGSKLIAALKLLNQEFSPYILFGAKPPSEGERDDE